MGVRSWFVTASTFAGLLVAGAFMFGGPRDFTAVEWPVITDATTLRREATALCRQEGGWRELGPAQYPPAMTRLRPASISVSSERVYIAFVPVPGGARYHGYYIWPDTIEAPDGGIVREQSDTGTPDRPTK